MTTVLVRCPKCRARVAEDAARCPRCGHDLLGDLVVLEEGPPPVVEAAESAQRGRAPGPPLGRVVVVLVALLGAAFYWVADGVSGRPAPTPLPSAGSGELPALREPTGSRLLAVVGGEAWVLDVDRGRAAPVLLPPGGVRAAVERARAVVVVVGDRAVAVFGADRLVDLGPADGAFAAGATDRVWLREGGSVREVSLATGAVTRGPHAVDAFAAVEGHGLLLHQEGGVLYVDADTAAPARLYRDVSIVVGAGGPWLVTADRDDLHCNIVAVELARSERRRGPLLPYRSCYYGRAVLSADGARLALPVAESIERVGNVPHAALFVVDVGRAAGTEVPGTRRPMPTYRSLTWSPSGRWLFWADDGGGRRIAAYRVGSGSAVGIDTTGLPAGRVAGVWAFQ